MTTVTIPAVFPDGQTYGGEPVTVRLRTGSRRPGFTGSTHVMGDAVHLMPRDGSDLSLDLYPNDGSGMDGTLYQVTVAEYVWLIQVPDSEDSFLVGDPTIATDQPPGVQYAPGPPGGQADVGPLAEMPATPPRAGAMWFAVDDRGGTMWIESAGVWVQSGPAVGDVGGAVIASAAPATIPSPVTIAAAATWYTLPGLTTATFEMPSRPVTVSLSQIYIAGASGDVDPSATEIRIQSTINGGSSWQDVLLPYRDTTNFIFDIFASGSARLRVDAGETVQLRCAVRRGDTGATLALAVDNAGLPLYPLLEARVG